MKTVDMEAMNSEESEEETGPYPMKTIFDWQRDTVNKKNISINRRTDFDIADSIREKSERVRKTQSRTNMGYE
jgi:hypothetical protein